MKYGVDPLMSTSCPEYRIQKRKSNPISAIKMQSRNSMTISKDSFPMSAEENKN